MVTNNNHSISSIDDVDREILDLIQNNGKLTIKEIADKVDKSPTAVRSRLQRLERDYVKKYVALIDCRLLGYREMVMASLRVNSKQSIEQLKTKIENMDKIKFGYIVTGEYPLFVMAKCVDHDDSMGLIKELRSLPGVEEVKTQIVLDRIKEDTTIIIPEEQK
jgi:Lrp/AsnC family leucine-responsive transcriptional regulator